MKRIFLSLGLVLALGLGLASAQNITRSLQGAQDPRGPVGLDTSNSAYFPGHINALGQMTASPSPASCGAGLETGVVSTNSTDVAGILNPQSTNCQIFFGSLYNSAPVCVLGLGTQGTVTGGPTSTTITAATTGFVLTSTASGGTYSYICIGNK